MSQLLPRATRAKLNVRLVFSHVFPRLILFRREFKLFLSESDLCLTKGFDIRSGTS